MNIYLKKKHYPLSREWNYRNITPKIIAEKTLNNNEGLIDYRFLCSYGEVQGLFVDINTADEKGNHSTDASRNVYDSNFNLLDVTVTRPRIKNNDINLPPNINEMKKYAQILSETFPFCRVDLYNVDGEIKFGELTFFHSGGVNKIYPEKYKYTLGNWIKLPT